MNYNVFFHSNFIKELKPLNKKYPSLSKDIENIIQNIENQLSLATELGGGFKKIRLKIKSKNKGSSGGARLIIYETLINLNENEVVFASIYDKSEYQNIDVNILKIILEN